MRNFVLLTLIALLHTATAQQCNTPILRDVISVDSTKTRFTRDRLGDDPAYITGLPLLDSRDPFIIRKQASTTFTRPNIEFILPDRNSPNYWITAIDIQQGPAGSNCISTAIIENIGIELKVFRAYTGFNVPFKAGTNGGNSVPYYNWKDLGGTVGNGRTTRLSFEPVRVDGVRFEVLTLDDLLSTVMNEVCMRVEIYGCEVSGNSPPSVNTGPLHQYNLIQASADTYGNLYTDSSYTGITSDEYLSGGTGILTDGTVGVNAESSPAQWLGWKRSDTSSIEVLFLLKTTQQFNRVNLIFWEDSSNNVSAPVNVIFTDHKERTLTFNPPEVFSLEGKVRVKSFTRNTPNQASYVKVKMEFDAGSDYILLSEVEFVRVDAINALTDANAIISTSPTTTPSTTPPLTTTSSTTTPPNTTSTSTSTTTVTTPTPTTTTITTPVTSAPTLETTTTPIVVVITTTPQTTTTTTLDITTISPEIITQTTSSATNKNLVTSANTAESPTSMTAILIIIIAVMLMLITLLILAIISVFLVAFYLLRRERKKNKLIHKQKNMTYLELYNPVNQDAKQPQYINIAEDEKSKNEYSGIATEDDGENRIYYELMEVETLSDNNEKCKGGEDCDTVSSTTI